MKLLKLTFLNHQKTNKTQHSLFKLFSPYNDFLLTRDFGNTIRRLLLKDSMLLKFERFVLLIQI